MAIVDLIMPKMGESIHEATIISWQKRIGEQVEVEEPVLDVATDKVDSDVPSPVTGILIETLASEGEVVQIGQVLARIQTDQGSTDTTNDVDEGNIIKESPAVQEKEEVQENPSQETVIEAVSPAPISQTPTTATPVEKPQPISAIIGERFYSPLVRNIARAEGISIEELESIPGTGGEGRITKHDLRKYVIAKRQNETAAMPNPMLPPTTSHPAKSQPQSAPVRSQPNIQVKQPVSNIHAGDEIIEMDRMRRYIADHMKQSQEVSATVTSFVEADATHLVHWRNKNKNEYLSKYGAKLTFTPLFVEAVIQAIQDYPDINASLSGDQIIKKRGINIGIATAMKNGNLIVPVIKNAGALNLQGLATQLNDLTGRARVNQLRADEVQDGTFTISNIGTYGNIMGTPIINQPQLAILALGAIMKKPVIQETPHGDIIAIRHMMYLSLSFDHRVIDGYLGGTFLNRIAHYIEAFDPNRPL